MKWAGTEDQVMLASGPEMGAVAFRDSAPDINEPAAPQQQPQQQQQQQQLEQEQQTFPVEAVKTDPDDGKVVLAVPYPVESRCSELQRQFPERLGIFVAGRPRNYAFRANKLAVNDTVVSLGYRVLEYTAVQPSAEAAPAKADNPDHACAEPAPEAAHEDAAEAAAAKLANELQSMPQSTMSLVFLKPPKLPWACLENCLTFEPYHQSSLFAADKWQMARILNRRAREPNWNILDAAGKVFNYERFTMYTVNPGFGSRQQIIKHLDENPGVYVLKRTNSSQGIGIYMYRASRPNTIERLRRSIGPNARLQRYVLQKYIERPLLVDKRKFDLRVYLLVLSCSCPSRPGEKGYFAFCHPGYVKVSSRAYAGESKDPRVHFTNQWVQRRGGRHYESVKEATTWLPDELNDYLEKRRRSGGSATMAALPADWCRRRMYRQMQTIAGYLAGACRPYLESRRPGCVFRIYGPDLIVDEQLRVSLLEFNCFPCYARNTTTLATSLGTMWREAVAVATEAALRYREGLTVEAPTTGVNFRQVYSSQDPQVLKDLVTSCYP